MQLARPSRTDTRSSVTSKWPDGQAVGAMMHLEYVHVASSQA